MKWKLSKIFLLDLNRNDGLFSKYRSYIMHAMLCIDKKKSNLNGMVWISCIKFRSKCKANYENYEQKITNKFLLNKIYKLLHRPFSAFSLPFPYFALQNLTRTICYPSFTSSLSACHSIDALIDVWITERHIVSIAPSASNRILRRPRRIRMIIMIIIIIWMHEIHSINTIF